MVEAENQNIIKITDVVGRSLCITMEDGQRVYDAISAALKEGKTVTLSFENIVIMIPTFLNSAIGQLYGEFDEQYIREHLTAINILESDKVLLKRVVSNAKEYFKKKTREIPAIWFYGVDEDCEEDI